MHHSDVSELFLLAKQFFFTNVYKKWLLYNMQELEAW